VGIHASPAGAAHTPVLPVWIEHVVIDDQLMATLEQVEQCPGAAVGRGEPVVLCDLDLGQPATLRSELVARPDRSLLALEKGRERGKPSYLTLKIFRPRSYAHAVTLPDCHPGSEASSKEQ
jgi:hypothetical protein